MSGGNQGRYVSRSKGEEKRERVVSLRQSEDVEGGTNPTDEVARELKNLPAVIRDRREHDGECKRGIARGWRDEDQD
ncbi:MAG: hypothetical protein ACE5JA_02130 [bacterium]